MYPTFLHGNYTHSLQSRHITTVTHLTWWLRIIHRSHCIISIPQSHSGLIGVSNLCFLLSAMPSILGRRRRVQQLSTRTPHAHKAHILLLMIILVLILILVVVVVLVSPSSDQSYHIAFIAAPGLSITHLATLANHSFSASHL